MKENRKMYSFTYAKKHKDSLFYHFSISDIMRIYLKLVHESSDSSNQGFVSDYMIESLSKLIKGLCLYQTVPTKNTVQNEEVAFQRFFYCPYCNKSHRFHEFLTPSGGRTHNDIVDKYKDQLIDTCFDFVVRRGFESYDLMELYANSIFDDETETEESKKNYRYNSLVNRMLERKTYIPAREEFEYDAYGVIFRCPDCGNQIKSRSSGHIYRNHGFDDFEGWNLTRKPSWKTDNMFFFKHFVFEKEDSPIITLSIINNHFFPNPYGKMMFFQSNERISFNTKTGQCYAFRLVDMKTKKALFPEMPRINCITYTQYPYIVSSISTEACVDLIKAIAHKKGISVNAQEIMENSKMNKIATVCAVNRFLGIFGDSFLKDYIASLGTYRLRPSHIDARDYAKSMYAFSKKPQKLLKTLKKEGITSKKLKKMCIDNPTLIHCFRELKKIGFTNIDNILKLFSAENKLILNELIEEIYSGNDNENIKIFIKEYALCKSETELFKKLITNNGVVFFKDTASIFASLSRKIKLTEKGKRELLSGSMKEIHDRIFVINDNLKNKNFYINYAEEDLSLNGVIGDYVFELAKTSNDMKVVGKEMHICVGSYDRKAWEKRCFIVFMKNNKGELQACIELSGDKKRLVQAKDYCNNVLDKHKLPILVKWLKENGILFDEGRDSVKNNLTEVIPSELSFENNPSTNGYNVVKKEMVTARTEYIDADFSAFGTMLESANNDDWFDVFDGVNPFD